MTAQLPTDHPPRVPATRVAATRVPLQLAEEHHLCPGCGHPVAWRLILELIAELEIECRAIGVVGHGCYTNIVQLADVDFLQCLHGRAPAVATGVKRVHPDAFVFTLQGDGDMANEGLAEVLHAAARGERITCIMLNNGVFGDTGGQMTVTTALGQRTKTSKAGREAPTHGYPLSVADLLMQIDGVAYVARGTVTSAGEIAHTKKLLRAAFTAQLRGDGFTFVEVLTMCPTGWFVGAGEGPEYLGRTLRGDRSMGELYTATNAAATNAAATTAAATTASTSEPVSSNTSTTNTPKGEPRND